jgi:hypothetical protein
VGSGRETEVVRVIRRGTIGSAFGGGSADQLPERGAVGRLTAPAVASGQIAVVTGFRTGLVGRR